MPNRAAQPSPIHSCSRPESRETLLSMTRLMRQASHPIDGCGSLVSSSGVMSPNVRCNDSWTRVNASSKISFAIMKVPSVACAYYKSKGRFTQFKSLQRTEAVPAVPNVKVGKLVPVVLMVNLGGLCERNDFFVSFVTKR